MHELTVAWTLFCVQFACAATHPYHFRLSRQHVHMSPGLSMEKTVVNGMFPGPLIRVPYNANMEIDVRNDLGSNGTTFHWHGIHQVGTPYSDGYPTVSQCPISPSDSLTYKFNAYPGGSAFWHAHFHEETTDGAYGPLIVEDEPGTFPYRYDEEKVILLTDAYNSTSWQVDLQIAALLENMPDSRATITDPEPNQGLVCLYDETKSPPTASCSSTSDGQGFNLNFERGKTYRLRLICTATIAPFVFSIDGHEMQVVAVDPSVTDGSAWVKGVPMMTGQRYDVLVRGREDVEDGAKFWVRSTLGNDSCIDYTIKSLNTDVRGIVAYGGVVSSSLPESTAWDINYSPCADLDYSTLKPLPSLSSIPDSNEKPTVMFLNFTFPSFVNGTRQIHINGNNLNVSDTAYPTLFHIQEDPSWKPTVPGEQRNIITIPDSLREKQVRFVIRSEIPTIDGGGHPFHAHGRMFKVLASGTGEFTQQDLDDITPEHVMNAISRDTVVVPKNGWVVTQFEAKNPGVWALHCHIAWHLGHGMVGQIVELPRAISEEIKIPQKMKDACRKLE